MQFAVQFAINLQIAIMAVGRERLKQYPLFLLPLSQRNLIPVSGVVRRLALLPHLPVLECALR